MRLTNPSYSRLTLRNLEPTLCIILSIPLFFRKIVEIERSPFCSIHFVIGFKCTEGVGVGLYRLRQDGYL